MTRDESITALGHAGERIVMNWLQAQGKNVSQSTDIYDHTKDLLIEGEKIEVKTQVPFVREKAFTIRTNQLRKCLSVGALYFVCVPNSFKPTEYDGRIYCISPKDMVTKKTTTKDGREMILIPIDQPGMQLVSNISKQDIDVLRKYTVSDYK